MRSRGQGSRPVALAVCCTAAVIAAPVQAQSDVESLFHRHVITFGVAGGGAAFSDFQRGQARTVTGDVDRRLTAQTTVALSAALTYWLSSSVAVRTHGSFSPTRFVVHHHGAEPAAARTEPATRLAALNVLMADVDLLFRAPIVFGRVAPYGILGAGVVRYGASAAPATPLPPEARDAFVRGVQHRFAGVFGAGAVIPLERHDFFLTFELTNHVTRSPIPRPASGATDEAAGILVDPDGWGGDEDGVTNNVRVMVGVTIPLAR